MIIPFCICSLSLHNSVPQTQWLNTTHVYYLTALSGPKTRRAPPGSLQGLAGHVRVSVASDLEAGETCQALSGLWLHSVPCSISSRPESSVAPLALSRDSLPASRNLPPVLAPGTLGFQSEQERIKPFSCLQSLTPPSTTSQGNPWLERAHVTGLSPPGQSPFPHITYQSQEEHQGCKLLGHFQVLSTTHRVFRLVAFLPITPEW